MDSKVLEIITKIITNILTAIYQSFGFALLFSFFFMYFYLYSYQNCKGGSGWKNAVKEWFFMFKKSPQFRKLFFLVLYTMLILFRTLLSRTMWLNPLSNVMGGWWIFKIDPATGDRTITTDCIENVVLFIPFTFMLLLMYKNRLNISKKQLFIKSMETVFMFSISIEFLQLFLRVGTFQLSDLFYNTLGAVIGTSCYLVYSKFK